MNIKSCKFCGEEKPVNRRRTCGDCSEKLHRIQVQRKSIKQRLINAGRSPAYALDIAREQVPDLQPCHSATPIYHKDLECNFDIGKRMLQKKLERQREIMLRRCGEAERKLQTTKNFFTREELR